MPLAMVVARPWRFQAITQRHRQTFNLRIAPHLHLRLHAWRRASEVNDARATMPLPARSVEAIAAAHDRAKRFVEYVHARARRVDATFGSAAAPVNAPVSRVVRRLAPATSVMRAVGPSPEAPATLASRLAAPSSARHGATKGPPAIDLERLTEHVIKGIDRRIIAQRERFGRP
jgi:hypothetical protein